MPSPTSRRWRPSHLLRAALCASLVALAPDLPAQGLISGRALLANSTRPLACVDAALRRTDGTLIATTFTREDGTFELEVGAEVVQLAASHRDYARSEAVHVHEGLPDEPLRLVLRRSRTGPWSSRHRPC